MTTLKYNPVYVELIIAINTSSGKITAGMVTLDATENGSFVLPLKKCSDKAASV
ncbi:MAG: hypothetical protein KDD45_08095 [Bdellovibrionales bacterium]|nr:hypothetical protein [Bdellovibrionales bacterium]